MNRIILIGNGFDLAHDLKTSYKSFIEWVWEEKIIKNVYTQDFINSLPPCDDDVVYFTVEKLDHEVNYLMQTSITIYKSKPKTIQEIIECVEIGNKTLNETNQVIRFTIKCQFLKQILDRCSLKSWVDIEEFYYIKLKEAARIDDEDKRYEGIVKLNDDLEVIKKLLNEYLLVEQSRDVQQIDFLEELIYAPF